MSETLGQVLSYINEALPNNMNSTTVISLINDEIKEYWEYLTTTELYEFNTVSSQALYSLPTNVTVDMITENGLMIADSTAAVTTTTVWQSYSFCGADEELSGSKFYDALDCIGIYPVPDNVYPARIRYQEYPTIYASSDTGTQMDIDKDYIKLIKYKTLARVAKFGKFPRVDLANNYEADAKEVERKMKMKTQKRRAKTPRSRWSYQDWKTNSVTSVNLST